MKLDARQVSAFLRNPGSCRLVLLHGDDEGLIREYSLTLTRQVAGSLGDPFLTSELMRESWGQIGAEMAALSMIGGRRVVVVREATDAALAPISLAMKGPGSALLIVEAASLAKGKLRSFAETAPDAVAIACYPEEGRALGDLIKKILNDLHVQADAEAIDWLAGALAGDRAVIRGEVEKLALLAGPGGRLDLEAAQTGTGDGAAVAGVDCVLAATLGQQVSADAALEAAIADGLNGVALLRMCLTHLQKLHQARLQMARGASATEAVRSMRPPVFFRAAAPMATALGLWPADRLLQMLEEARSIELACKQTGSRPDLLARRFIHRLASVARTQRGTA